MFDLGGRQRDDGGGRKTPPSVPASVRQRRSRDEEGEDEYSFMSYQARSTGGGPPAGNITFTLRGTEAQPPARVTQQDVLGIDDGGDKGREAQNHFQQAHGMPAAGQAAREGIPRGESRALATGVELSPQYLGFDNAIKKWGTGTEVTIERDLKWQRDMDGDPQKIAYVFKEVVGGLQDFRTYLFMKPGSAFVTVLHSLMKFVAISEATQHLQGRYIGYVGDRTISQDPISIVLPQQKTWSWEAKTVSTNAGAMHAYYEEDSTRRGNLWAPALAGEGREAVKKAHILLAIPVVLFQAIHNEKKALMPHDIHALTMGIVTTASEIDRARDN